MAVTQAKYRVTVYIGTDNTGTRVFDSGWLVDQVSDFNLPNGVLQNSTTYTVQVEIEDSNGIQSLDQNTFSTSWVAPTAPAFTVDPGAFENNGYVSITWSHSAIDGSWISWRVYRTLATGTPQYTLIYEIDVDQPTYTYQDYLVASGVGYKYVVIQTANRFGSLVESSYSLLSATVTPNSTHYWLIDPDPTGFQIKIPNVTADTYTDVYEKQELDIIERGRKIDYGTRWGYSGTLTSRLYDDGFTGITAAQKRRTLEAQKALRHQIYLRDPFGNMFLIALDDLQISRIAGVGQREFCDLTLPYLEVTAI